MGTEMVCLGSLGLCEHCGTLITLEGMPAEAVNSEWKCPKCGKVLTHKSFGFKTAEGEKIKWVGPDKKWTKIKPTDDFRLGNWDVIVRPIAFSL